MNSGKMPTKAGIDELMVERQVRAAIQSISADVSSDLASLSASDLSDQATATLQFRPVPDQLCRTAASVTYAALRQ